MSEQLTVDELLIAHAAGKLPEPVALAVASHLALSPQARAHYARYEALGGVLLDRIEPETLESDAWSRMLARLDAPEEAGPEERPAAAPAPGEPLLPWPLRRYVPGRLDDLSWRRYGMATESELTIRCPGYRTTLIRVSPGRKIPKHTHEGHELTLVLNGAYTDELGLHRRGDLAIADSSVDHLPVADPNDGCLCLAVTDAPLRLTGLFGRFLNPFVRF